MMPELQIHAWHAHSVEKMCSTTLDNQKLNWPSRGMLPIDRTCIVVMALSNQPEAFASDLGDDQSRYLCKYYSRKVTKNASPETRKTLKFGVFRPWKVAENSGGLSVQTMWFVCVLQLAEKLSLLTQYLRSTHCYCVWCGTAFDGLIMCHFLII